MRVSDGEELGNLVSEIPDMDDQLQELIDLQREQNHLLKRYLWRLRFSLLGLLLMTTATAIGLGVMVYQTRPRTPSPPFAPVRGPIPAMPKPGPAVPAGDIELRPTIPGQS
jgi:hypothetical protein